MFSVDRLHMAGLPDRTLVLTFDDGPGETLDAGPGPRTLDLGEYLAGQAILATFFLTGGHAAELPRAPAELRALGHQVGNHTYTHPHLPETSPIQVVDEVRRTHELLGSPGTTYFRAPYGQWSPAAAEALNADPLLSEAYVGPVHWDIEVEDWSYWRDGRDPQECADAFRTEIDRVGSGVVLMHDSTADLPEVKAGNRCLEMVQLLVPRLLAEGYRFLPLSLSAGQ